MSKPRSIYIAHYANVIDHRRATDATLAWETISTQNLSEPKASVVGTNINRVARKATLDAMAAYRNALTANDPTPSGLDVYDDIVARGKWVPSSPLLGDSTYAIQFTLITMDAGQETRHLVITLRGYTPC